MMRALLLGGLGLRLWLCLCAIVAALGLADVSQALTRVELYQATAPLTERSEAGQEAAFEAALRTVMSADSPSVDELDRDVYATPIKFPV